MNFLLSGTSTFHFGWKSAFLNSFLSRFGAKMSHPDLASSQPFRMTVGFSSRFHGGLAHKLKDLGAFPPFSQKLHLESANGPKTESFGQSVKSSDPTWSRICVRQWFFFAACYLFPWIGFLGGKDPKSINPGLVCWFFLHQEIQATDVVAPGDNSPDSVASGEQFPLKTFSYPKMTGEREK